MARGLVSGLVWGVVISAGGLVVGNEVAGRVEFVSATPPSEIAPQTPDSPVAPQPPQVSAEAPGEVSVPETVVPGAPPVPGTEGESSMPMANTDPAARPEPAPEPGGAMQAPSGDEVALAEAPGEEEPIIPGPESQAPAAASTETAPLPAPGPNAPAESPSMAAAPVEDSAAQPETPAPAASVASAPAPAAPEPAQSMDAPAVLAEAPMPEPEPEPAADDQQMAAATPEPEKPGLLETREGTLADRAENVTVGRLPSIGGAVPAAPEDEAPQMAEPTGQALVDNAVAFERDPTKPMMSVILLDDGGEISDGDLANLPFPLTFAIRASAPDAAARAARYRAAGQEVVLITELPAGAKATDAAVTLEAAMGAVPGAVAVMDVPGAMFQSSRGTAAQVIASAWQSGYGVITYARGLNAAQQVAEREGVPAAVVFRVFDGEGRNVSAMKRYLDQAAFRSGQTEGLITVGHLKDDTLQALADWVGSSRAASVDLAPVSTVLKAQLPDVASAEAPVQ